MKKVTTILAAAALLTAGAATAGLDLSGLRGDLSSLSSRLQAPATVQEAVANLNASRKYVTAPIQRQMREGEQNPEWTVLGVGTYRDDIMTTFAQIYNQDIEVVIEQNVADPNTYRIQDPYAGWANPFSDLTFTPDATRYLTFHIVNDQYAYIDGFDTGISGAVLNGDATVYPLKVLSQASSLIAGNGIDAVMQVCPGALATYEEGVIRQEPTFELNGNTYYSLLVTPDGSGKNYRTNENGEFTITMPDPANPQPTYNWVSLGTGKYTEDMFTSVYQGATTEVIDVEVQQDADNPDHYRIPNPYANSTQYGARALDGEIEFYVVDGTYVNITKFKSGLYNLCYPLNPQLFVKDMLAEFDIPTIVSVYADALPKIADNVITCAPNIGDGETPTFQIPYTTGYLAANTNGAFRIEIPKKEEPVNPYAPTGQEVVKGQLQTLYKATKDKLNILEGAAQLGEGADGWKVQCMNTAKNIEQAGSITIDGTAYATMKFSNGAQHTVTLPEGYVANAVWIYSVINKEAATTRPCFFKEIDGETYTSDRDYLVSYKDFANPDVSYFPLKGNNTFTITNSGEQVLVVLVVDYSEAPKTSFGEGVLEAPAIWPLKGNKMLPLSGNIELTFAADVQVAGKATLNGAEVDMKAEGAKVSIAYADLTPATEYTLTIPAATIGNAEAANAEITLTYTTEPANVLFYADFNMYPRAYYDLYGNATDNVNIIEKGSTDVTKEIAGMTFYSGNSGRIVAMRNSDVSDDPEADYGPYTAEDAGASPRDIQLIDGGNALYVETPQFEGPAVVTFYVGNPSATAGSLVVTDDRALKDEPLATLEMPAAKKTFKYTVVYPYKGAATIRLYNQKMKVNLYDILVVKGEGEGIDRPVPAPDTEAPVALAMWPDEAPYAPLAGTASVIFDEPVTATGDATLNGTRIQVKTDGTLLTADYEGLEAGKEYTLVMPAVTDEAGNATQPIEIKINTAPADVYYYTDFGKYPYDFYTAYRHIPVEGKDNEDIIAKNSTDVTATAAGITYYSGTRGRVVAMGKPNLNYEDNGTATPRCIQIIGGGGDLYLELPAVAPDAELTLVVGNSATKSGDILLTDAQGNKEAPLATFNLPAEKKVFTFTHSLKGAGQEPVALRIYNNGIQFNIHDILLKKGLGDSGIGAIEAADGDAEAVYYNLQGQRVDNPAAGLYIRVRGNKAEKVVIR